MNSFSRIDISICTFTWVFGVIVSCAKDEKLKVEEDQQITFMSDLAVTFDLSIIFVCDDDQSGQDLTMSSRLPLMKSTKSPTLASCCSEGNLLNNRWQDYQSTFIGEIRQPSATVVFTADNSNIKVNYDQYRNKNYVFIKQELLEEQDDIINLLHLDSSVYSFKSQENNSIVLFEHYSIKHNRHISRIVAKWSKIRGFQWLADPNVLVRRSNLENVTLVAATIEFGNYVIVDGNVSVTLPRGFFIDIAETLSEKLNFTIEYVGSVDGQWGTVEEESGVWNGMVGMLIRSEVDMVTAALSITLERSTVIDYTVPLVKDKDTLSVSVPRGTALNFWAYADVFTRPSWFGVLLCMLILAAALCYLSTDFSMVKSAVVQCTMLLQRNNSSLGDEVKWPGKLVYQSSEIFAFFVFAVYSAVLTSLMTSGSPAIPITALADLSSEFDVDYSIVVMYGSSNYASLKNAKEGTTLNMIYRNFIKGKESQALVGNVAEARERMIQHSNVLFYGSRDAFLGDKDITALKLRDAISDHLAFGLQPNSELRHLFNHHLMQMSQTGVLDNLLDRWLKDEKLSQEDGAFALGYDNVLFPFTILAAGMGGAMIFLLAEVIRQMCLCLIDGTTMLTIFTPKFLRSA